MESIGREGAGSGWLPRYGGSTIKGGLMKVIVEGWILERKNKIEPAKREYLCVSPDGDINISAIKTDALVFIFDKQAKAFGDGWHVKGHNPFNPIPVELEAR